MHAAFIIKRIVGVAGGAEKALVALANNLARRGHHVTILTFDKFYGDPLYPVAPDVEILNLNQRARAKPQKQNDGKAEPEDAKVSVGRTKQKKGKNSFLKNLYYPVVFRIRNRDFINAISDYVEQHTPDIVTVFMANSAPQAASALRGKNIATIFASRVTPEYDLISSTVNDPNKIKKNFTLSQLRHFDQISVLVPSYKDLLPAHLQEKVKFIPNDVPVTRMQEVRDIPLEERPPRIVYVGRLEEYKGAMILLKAFAMIAAKFPDWTVDVYGEGTMRSDLAAFIEEKGLQNRVRLRGVIKNIEQAYRSAQVFCLPSTHEGFSRSLSEAMACGLACLGFRSCEGMKYLLSSGGGLLVDYDCSGRTIAEALDGLLSRVEARQELGGRAVETIRSFDEEEVFSKWEQFLKETVSQKACAGKAVR